VILVDPRKSKRTTEAMTSITPEIGYPCMNQVTWNMGFFQDPFPFSEEFFLVSHSSGLTQKKHGHYGIYTLDAWGNRALLYSDPEISSFQPMPLRPRRTPPVIAPASGTHKIVKKNDKKKEETGTMYVQDVYQGMTGIERGRVKFLRVMAAVPWGWGENGRFRNGLPQSVHRKKLFGVAKVHEDGSAHFKVPANEAIFFQALDKDYMALQHMPTYINVMPGEKRSCIGCHEDSKDAPRVARPKEYPVQTLTPQPGDTGPRLVHYPTDIQPIWDKHCVSCHSGDEPKGNLVLTGERKGVFTLSYENILSKGLVSYRDSRYGRSGIQSVPPLSSGSHLSQLTEQIRKDPCKGDLTREEFIRIVTWIDSNSPFFGDYTDFPEYARGK
jgi:hypothetical protein